MVGILIVFFNDLSHIQKLASSLKSQDFTDFRLYCIDNNPSLHHVEALKKYFPDLVALASKGNIGFAKGNNILAQKAIEDGCNYIFILNPDMELAANSLHILKKTCDEDRAIGICSAVLLFGQSKRDDEEIQLFGGKADFRKQKKEFLFRNQFLPKVNLPVTLSVDFVNGGSAFIRKDLIIECGLFEERYFMYNDEIDLAFRSYKAGFKTVVTSRAKIWHHHDWVSKKNCQAMYYYMMRNRILYFKKYKLYYNLCLDLVFQIITIPVKVKWFWNLSNMVAMKYYYWGILMGILGEHGMARINFNE